MQDLKGYSPGEERLFVLDLLVVSYICLPLRGLLLLYFYKADIVIVGSKRELLQT